MCAYRSPIPDKSSAEFHRRSYRLLAQFLDGSRYGSVMFVLREKNLPDATARRRNGLDIVDIFSIGTDSADPQILHIHSLHQGDKTVELAHTYMYWAQLVTLNEFLEDRYHMSVPYLNRPAKENGMLACVELQGAHMARLPDRYVIWTFRLKPRGKHRCPEETATQAADTVVQLGDLNGIGCPYCLAEQLNLNL